MDMEKIMIQCNADYLQFEFPKRKWYKLRQYNRIATMRLAFADKDLLDADIGLEIYENYEEEPIYHIESGVREDLYEAMLVQYNKNYKNAEHLIVVDHGDGGLQFGFPRLCRILIVNVQVVCKGIDGVQFLNGLLQHYNCRIQFCLGFINQLWKENHRLCIPGSNIGG